MYVYVCVCVCEGCTCKNFKGTVMQIEEALINDCLHVLKVS